MLSGTISSSGISASEGQPNVLLISEVGISHLFPVTLVRTQPITGTFRRSAILRVCRVPAIAGIWGWQQTMMASQTLMAAVTSGAKPGAVSRMMSSYFFLRTSTMGEKSTAGTSSV